MAAMLLFMPMVLPAQAADASAWDKDMHSALRLIAAGAPRGGATTFRAGIEIRLDSGWKTYWRYPGDSGVPPRFAFAGSENVKNVTVKWPAPHRFSDDGGQSIGYKEYVILPLVIEPDDANKPVKLRLHVDYAVCAKLCVPAEGKAEVMVTRDRTAHDATLAAAEARVPERRALGDTSSLSIRAIRRDASGRIAVDLAAPEGSDVDLFAEGPTEAWAMPLPEPTPGAAAGLKRFMVTLDGLPPGATATGATLTFTAVAGAAAIEVPYRVD
ncbi:MAG TPA: protein-disulfide reductase DsbD domain-containing protein [Xanthobacteraceae bacterium]|nr:protein-disulfide reductase DsbD domain-containing protein [Xanthobacteraceae bacterium]